MYHSKLFTFELHLNIWHLWKIKIYMCIRRDLLFACFYSRVMPGTWSRPRCGEVPLRHQNTETPAQSFSVLSFSSADTSHDALRHRQKLAQSTVSSWTLPPPFSAVADPPFPCAVWNLAHCARAGQQLMRACVSSLSHYTLYKKDQMLRHRSGPTPQISF
jgi:hypothetical protein